MSKIVSRDCETSQTGTPEDSVRTLVRTQDSRRRSLMRVEQLMTKTVQSCRPGDSLEHAAQLMWSYDCGCLPVCTADGVSYVVGVVTDRGICMSALFQGKPLRDL